MSHASVDAKLVARGAAEDIVLEGWYFPTESEDEAYQR
jgi:hypothetical protein